MVLAPYVKDVCRHNDWRQHIRQPNSQQTSCLAKQIASNQDPQMPKPIDDLPGKAKAGGRGEVTGGMQDAECPERPQRSKESRAKLKPRFANTTAHGLRQHQQDKPRVRRHMPQCRDEVTPRADPGIRPIRVALVR